MKNTDAWERLSSEPETDLSLFKSRFEQVRNPLTGKTVRVVTLTGNDSVTVMAVTKGNNVVLVDNFRFGVMAYLLELPGGMVDDGEDHRQSARRELLEETGYAAPEWHYVGCVAANPVFMDSYVHHYLAIGAERVADPDLDDGEDIRAREMSLEELRKMLFNGEFQHPHTVCGALRGLEMLERGL